MTDVGVIANHLDSLLGTESVPDYPNALNGLQLANRAPIRRIAASVDISRRVIDEAIRIGANLLLVHHGMFWSGAQRLTGTAYERLRLLIAHDIAVYSSHLPLDAHPTFGNNVLLARALSLEPAGGFARYQTLEIGVRGHCDRDTAELRDTVATFAQSNGGIIRCTDVPPGRRTRRWGICTGAGASSETVREAQDLELDTMIVGEGPHHTAVTADDLGLVIMYAGHYATETLGVQALADYLTEKFGIQSSFIRAPTGL
jgi:dinuclear metal center YbgI/SA1388 family protein